MGKAKWWVCSECTSLNDLPANKCYKCRAERPSSARLIDDEYSEVSSAQDRVSVSVDLSKLGDLSAPDPRESAKGGHVIEAFGVEDAPATEPPAVPEPPRPHGTDWSKPRVMPPKPLRDPTPRGISAIGGRPWSGDGATTPLSPPPAPVPQANGYAPPNGYVQPPAGPAPTVPPASQGAQPR